MPKPSPSARIVREDADQAERDAIGAAFLAEEAAAKAAVAEAQAALPEGERLTAADRRSIRSEYGVQRLANGDGPAAYRLRSRDGLTSAVEARAITVLQHKAGLAYRMCFEAQTGGLQSVLGNAGMRVDGGTLSVGIGSRDPAALKAVYLVTRLRQMEGGLSDRELTVIRAVAGEGRTVRSLGGGGNARTSNIAALASGLEKIAGGLRIGGH